ncbi:MAG: ATP-binding cassette domain-containing protein, partial [Sphaerochaetaceae bacterium]|nr:ATP-binding cassette domain-containing protein [Sphaerochaetaceae bacterium]
ESVKCIFGLTKNYDGDIYYLGEKKHYSSAKDALKDGISLVPEDRKEEGLYLIQSVEYNTTIEVLHEFIKGIRMNKKKEGQITQKYVDLMDTKTPSLSQKVGNLSGGNQQKVLIGRWLATKPKLLILDEPTRGVDVGAKAEIYSIMNELVKEGLSIIMISSELPEIINMSDRVYVFAHGKVKGCLNHTELTQKNIMHLAAE